MRNDARPIGESAGHQSPIEKEQHDSRDSVAHDRESHIVNREAEERQPAESDDPVMPSSDSALNTKI
jgi:hypothetical protein